MKITKKELQQIIREEALRLYNQEKPQKSQSRTDEGILGTLKSVVGGSKPQAQPSGGQKPVNPQTNANTGKMSPEQLTDLYKDYTEKLKGIEKKMMELKQLEKAYAASMEQISSMLRNAK